MTRKNDMEIVSHHRILYSLLALLFALAVISPISAAAQTNTAVNLIFIHHSCGENWLNDGLLARTLNENGYHAADISYGWREYGDCTDTGDWPMWFTDEVMPLVYTEYHAMSAPNAIPAAAGENTIILFKSCFPCSDVGDSMEDEMAVYESLLPYFSEHPDKLFTSLRRRR